MSILASEIDFFVVVSDHVNTLSRSCHAVYHSDAHSSVDTGVDFFQHDVKEPQISSLEPKFQDNCLSR